MSVYDVPRHLSTMSRDIRQWALSQRIRTVAAISLSVGLVDDREIPLYQQLAGRAEHLRELGLSYRAIATALGTDHKLAAKAVTWAEIDGSEVPNANGPSWGVQL